MYILLGAYDGDGNGRVKNVEEKEKYNDNKTEGNSTTSITDAHLYQLQHPLHSRKQQQHQLSYYESDHSELAADVGVGAMQVWQTWLVMKKTLSILQVHSQHTHV